MCGIAALFAVGNTFDGQAIVPMTRDVAHRGPDGEGFVALGGPSGGAALDEVSLDAPAARLALGHRRLSILDLSEAGRQPMRRGALWLTYNGEIFNYVEVRDELHRLGHRFDSDSDTEVLLAGWQQWGPGCLQRLRGMWGFVLVDSSAKKAWLCRDRMGIKPLYVRRAASAIGVASEIKQLAHLGSLEPDDDAVAIYLQTGFENPRRTFFRDVEPVPEGTFRTLDLERGTLGAPEPYWFPENVTADISDPTEAARQLETVLRDSVTIHLRSDVPVGCALSGGLDSSAVAALVAQQGARLETFSAVFPGFRLDETRFIDTVVAHTGARSHRVSPTPAELLADLDRFLWCHDEPVGSLSQYAAYAVARLTRSAGVPVTLNGQGGDEVLGGYWQTTFAALSALRREPWQLLKQLAPVLAPGGNRELFAQVPAMLKRYVSRLRPDVDVRLRRRPSVDAAPALKVLQMSERERRVYELRELTLPRLLKWDDRNFMAFAVEGRYPFLDHLVIERCLRFDRKTLFVAGWTKEPLRRALDGQLPNEIVRRRGKIGFETPQHQWMNGALGAAIDAVVQRPSPLYRWVAQADAQQLARKARRRGSREALQAMVRLFLVDRWLRTKGIDR